MVAVRIPGTSRIIFVPKHAGDIVIDMTSYPEIDNSIKQEDVEPIMKDNAEELKLPITDKSVVDEIYKRYKFKIS